MLGDFNAHVGSRDVDDEWCHEGVHMGNRDLNDAGKRATLFSVNQ